jgi:hypothetical protein
MKRALKMRSSIVEFQFLVEFNQKLLANLALSRIRNRLHVITPHYSKLSYAPAMQRLQY